MAVVDSGRRTKRGKIIWKAAPSRPTTRTRTRSRRTPRSSGGKTRAQLEAETKAKLIAGIKQQDTRAGRALRGEDTKPKFGTGSFGGGAGGSFAPEDEFEIITPKFGKPFRKRKSPETIGGKIQELIETPGVMGAIGGGLGGVGGLKSVKDFGKFVDRKFITDIAAKGTGLAKDAWKVGQNFKGAKYILNKNPVGTLTKVKGVISKTQINTKTTSQTIAWITKIFTELKRPRLVAATAAATLVGAITSYPFAFFIKQEALQIMRGVQISAMIQKNPEIAQIALEGRLEIVNPNFTERLLDKIPFVNSVKQLLDLFETEKAAIVLDQQLIEDMKFQIENKLTDDDMWEKRKADDRQAEIEMGELFDERNKQRNLEKIETEKELIRLRAEAADIKNDTAIKLLERSIAGWNKRDAEQRRLDELDQIAQIERLIAYRELVQKMQDEARPSKLNFGLLR